MFFPQQLISAFERALQMMVDVPSEAHRNLSQDYIKCLLKVGQHGAKTVMYIIIIMTGTIQMLQILYPLASS